MNAHTPGPWAVFNMVNEDGSVMTAEQIGEYVKANVIKSINSGGSAERFLFVASHDGTGPDICHVGNGPVGPYNAALIAAAPELLAALDALVTACEVPGENCEVEQALPAAIAAIAKATGEQP